MAWTSGKEAINGNVEPISNVSFDKDQLLIEWKKAQDALNAAKANELALRSQVASTFFPAEMIEALPEGTKNVELGNGWKLKAGFKVNRSLDNKDDAVDKCLSKIEKLGAEGKFIADRIVKWEPKLDKREWDKAPDKIKKILAEVLTEKPGQVSIELVPPKVK